MRKRNTCLVKLPCRKGNTGELAIQDLRPMELTCSNYKAPKEAVLDPNAQDFLPKRNVAVAANERMKEITDYKTELPDVE